MEKILLTLPNCNSKNIEQYIDKLQTFFDLTKIRCDSISRVTKYKIVPPKGQILVAS